MALDTHADLTCAESDEFVSDVSLRLYLRGNVFRHHQDGFLARHGPGRTGLVVEVGGKRGYDLQRFFPDADRYLAPTSTGTPMSVST